MKAEFPKDEGRRPAPTAKKPYEAPVLRDWGTLKDITLSTGTQTHSDGGRPPYNHTG
jgi:hypothetical protein